MMRKSIQDHTYIIFFIGSDFFMAKIGDPTNSLNNFISFMGS